MITSWSVARPASWRDRVRPSGRLIMLGVLLVSLLLGACTAPVIPATATLPAATVPASATPSIAATRTPSSTPSASASPTPTIATATATVVRADVVITDAQREIVTIVKVGQIINVVDHPEFEWSVSFYDQVLLALTPPEKMKKPGASGWFLRAIAPGHTAITLESIPPPCPPGTRCPPTVMRLVFPIQVVP